MNHRRIFASLGATVAGILTLGMAQPAAAWIDNQCGLWSATASYRHASGLPSEYVSTKVDAKDLWNSSTDANFIPASVGQVEKVYMTAYAVHTATYDGMWTASECNSSGHSVGTVNVMLNRKYTDDYSSSAKKSVMVHELGHAVGLGHSGSTNCSGQPIMYPYSSRFFTCGHIGPQVDDINGANSLL